MQASTEQINISSTTTIPLDLPALKDGEQSKEFEETSERVFEVVKRTHSKEIIVTGQITGKVIVKIGKIKPKSSRCVIL